MRRLLRFLGSLWLATNQLVNAASGGRADQTVSARAAEARDNGSKTGAVICRMLDVVDFAEERKGEDHCAKAQRHGFERAAARLRGTK